VTPQVPITHARSMWGMFAMSFFMFVGVIFFLGQQAEPRPESMSVYGPAFCLLALCTASLMPFIRKKLMGAQTLPLLMEKSSGPWDQDLDPEKAASILSSARARYTTGMIVGFALCESTVLFGFCLAFLTMMPIVILPFAAAGLAGLVWQFPTEAGIQAVARQLRAKSLA